jgi:hypothetical protein
MAIHALKQVLLFCSAGLLSMAALADSAGENLARRVYDRPDGKDATSLVTMTLTEKGRAPRVRKMISYRLDKKAGEIATLIRFTEPADIEGTGLLTLDHADSDSEQWIYLPALERVRRIASNRKAGRFVNSDYYYEDLRSRKVERDEHRIIGRENVGGVNCEILESTPVEADSSVYLKRQVWLDPKTLLPMRIDFYEKREDQPSKRWQQLKKDRVKGLWTVMDSTLTDLASGHQTRLTVEEILYDRLLPAKLFSTQTLEDESAEEDYRP